MGLYNLDKDKLEDVTLEKSVTTEWKKLGKQNSMGIQVVITNVDAVGTFKMEGTIDGSNTFDIPFIDEDGISFISYSVSSGTSVSVLLNIEEVIAAKVRFKYTRTSGANTNKLSLYIRNVH